MADESIARVDLRHHTLAQGVAWTPGDGPGGASGFLALPEPPPVGTVLHLQPGNRAFAVTHVVESGHTGAYVRDASKDDLDRHVRIGTEGLHPRQLDSTAAPPPSDSDLTGDDPAHSRPTPDFGLAVPAPVAEPEPSTPIGIEGEDAVSGERDEPALGSDSGGEDGRGGKRRKGRRRS